MTDPIRDQAIEAAAKADYKARPVAWLGPSPEWDGLDEPTREEHRHLVTPLVDAVLAVAGIAYRAEGRQEAAQAMEWLPGLIRAANGVGWDEGHRDVCADCNCPSDANPYRADAEEESFNKGGLLNGPIEVPNPHGCEGFAWKYRAEAAERKVARVEAVCVQWVSEFPDSTQDFGSYVHAVTQDVRAALADEEGS